jgi:hypothetical protein
MWITAQSSEWSPCPQSHTNDQSVLVGCFWKLHTEQVVVPSPSHSATDGQSASLSWCRATSGTHDQMLCLGSVRYSMSRHVASSLTRGRVCNLSSVLAFVKSVHIYILHSISFHIRTVYTMTMYNIYMVSVSRSSVQQIMPYLTVHCAVTAA